MTFKREQNFPALRVPRANYSVGTSGEKHSSVRTERKRFDDPRMAHEPEPSFACPSVKDLNSISPVRWKGRYQTAIVIQDTVVDLSKLSLRSCAEVEEL